eukprot:TRINITY_DN3200_c0_g1_i3.p1 TRINITY_DN3200_c0_g1~~TRINITY_DN3200_c0_g1_i3.p1  ORF type:complete len:352 (-),score=80.35 TRINITY_DN3200_c0_g1_i3:421-1476(-)
MSKMGRTMTQAAVKIGARMGVQLRGGTPVKASGNCLIESIKGNIDERDIFDLKLNESSIDLRLKSALEGERVIGESPYRIEDYNDVEWAQGWNLLKNEGIWDVEYFGDLMIIALAHYIHKNILLINTDPDSPKITVIFGDQFGQQLDSDAPVILAYSGDHYESLIPHTGEDEEKVKSLIGKYVNGEDLCQENLDNKTGDENNDNRKMNIIETVKEFPKFYIDNWEHHKGDNKTRALSTSLQHLVLSTTENASKPVLAYQSSVDNEDRESVSSPVQIAGIDNWKHCLPGRGTSSSTTSNTLWEDEKVSTPIPIIHIRSSPKMITIPITRGPTKPCKQEFITNWEDSVGYTQR